MTGYSQHSRGVEGRPTSPHCRACKDAYNAWQLANRRAKGVPPKNWGANERKEIIKAYKYHNPCTDCEQFYDPVQMDLDHVVPRSETHAVRNQPIFNLSWEEFWEEMEVVEPVCSNCHRLRTQSRRLGIEFIPRTGL